MLVRGVIIQLEISRCVRCGCALLPLSAYDTSPAGIVIFTSPLGGAWRRPSVARDCRLIRTLLFVSSSFFAEIADMSGPPQILSSIPPCMVYRVVSPPPISGQSSRRCKLGFYAVLRAHGYAFIRVLCNRCSYTAACPRTGPFRAFGA